MKLGITNSISKRTEYYLIIQWLAVVIATLFFHASSTFFWSVNLISFVLLFARYIRFAKKNMLILAMLFLLTGMLSVGFSLKYFDLSIKSIGTSVGVIIIPMYLLLFSSFDLQKPFDEKIVVHQLQILSVLGTITMLAAFILSGRNMIGVLLGSLNAYNVSLSGIFYSKNIYGAFVAISMGADILLTHLKEKSNYEKIACLAKFVSVILSSSRAAMLMMGVFIVAFLLFTEKKSFKEWLLVIAILLFIIMIFFSDNAYMDFFEKNILRVNIGDAGRTDARTSALDSVPKTITTYLFGVGYSGIDFFNIDIDNSYLNEYFTGGIIKIILVLVSVLYSIKKSICLRKCNSALGNMCLSITSAYLVYAFYESTPILELGIINYCFMFFMFILPCAYTEKNQIR